MMKRLIGLAAAAIGAAGLAASSHALGVGLEAHGLYAFNFHDEDDLGYSLENAFGGGLSLAFALHENVRLDFGLDYFNPHNEDNSDWDVEFIPVCLGLRFGGHLEKIFLYGGGGAGYSFNWRTLAWGDEGDFENSMIYFVCGGAEIALAGPLALRGELRYNWLRPELSFDGPRDDEDLNFDHLQVRAGVGLNF